jgi:hypothetical protein
MSISPVSSSYILYIIAGSTGIKIVNRLADFSPFSKKKNPRGGGPFFEIMRVTSDRMVDIPSKDSRLDAAATDNGAMGNEGDSDDNTDNEGDDATDDIRDDKGIRNNRRDADKCKDIAERYLAEANGRLRLFPALLVPMNFLCSFLFLLSALGIL